MSCPVCGKRHHPGTRVGFTNMNRTCLKKWQRQQKKGKK